MSAILVIDDDPAFFHILEGMLAREGFTLHYVRESIRAMEAVEQLQPQIILTDLMMPKKNGIELCREIKGRPEFSHIPIILLTGIVDEGLLAQCLEAGANEFLNKDVSGSELRARVRSMVRFRQQYDDLRRSIQLRQDVAHMIVHDLGGPLGTIMLEVDDLLTGEFNPGQRQALEKIRNNAKRIHGMSHDMLMLAKMEDGKLRLDLQERKLSQSILEAIENLSSQAKRRKLTVEFLPFSEEKGSLYDTNLILRVLENILSNAIKFSPFSGKIQISLLSVGQWDKNLRRIEVRDEGPGIPEDLKEKVFEKFEVVQLSKTTPQLGLGLAFCRMAVEAHGGKIGVLANGAKGSNFWFEL